MDELSQLQMLASLDPQTPRTIAIALAEARQGQFDGAIATLTAAAEQEPGHADLQLALGRVYLLKAERGMDRRAVTLALTSLESALTTTTRRSEALTLLGRALYLSGDPGGALRVLDDALAARPIVVDAFGFRADAAERLNQFDDARQSLIKLDALEGDTAAPVVRAARARRIGGLALKAGDIPAARLFLQRAVDGGHKDVTTLAELADAEWREGRQDDARRTLAEAAALDPRHPDVVRLRRVIR